MSAVPYDTCIRGNDAGQFQGAHMQRTPSSPPEPIDAEALEGILSSETVGLLNECQRLTQVNRDLAFQVQELEAQLLAARE